MSNLSVKTRVAIINEKIEDLREDFANYIKDKTIPLKERWTVFANANDALSNHEPWIFRFKSINMDKELNLQGSAPEICGIGRVFKVTDWLEELYEREFFAWEKSESRDRTDSEWEVIFKFFEPLQEEILENNIKSWCYDW
jgi:hypothetical protein